MTQIGDALRGSSIFNLSGAVTMVVDDSPFAMELTTNALLGFGIKARYVCRNAIEAMDILSEFAVDLIIIDSDMPGMDGFDLARWIRRSAKDPSNFAPILMTAGHVRRRQLEKARDCGVNFLITKPFSAVTLLERVLWVARDQRPFLTVGDYFGPDRRFRPSQPREVNERREDMRRLLALQEQKALEVLSASQNGEA